MLFFGIISGLVVLIGLSIYIQLLFKKQKKLKQNLEEQKHLYHETLANFTEAVILLDIDARVTYINKAAEKLIEFKNDEAQGKSIEMIFRIVDKTTSAPNEIPFKKMIIDGSLNPLIYHVVLVSRKEHRYDIDLSLAYMTNQKGKINGLALVFSDVTKQIEMSQVFSHLSKVAELSQDAYFFLSMEGIVKSWSKQAEVIFECSAAQAIGKPFSDLIALRNYDEISSLVRELKLNKIVTNSEKRIITKTGQIVYLRINGSLVRDRQKNIIGYSLIARDIGNDKQAEVAFQKFQILSGYISDMVLFVRTSDEQIIETNTAALNEYGYTEEEILRLRIQDLMAPETLTNFFEQREKALIEGVWFEIIQRRKDGSLFPTEVNFYYTVIHDEKTIICVFRNIEKRKKTEAALIRLSFHDSHTGLYNRNFFQKKLEQFEQLTDPLGIVICDVDDLKIINDTLGRLAGDKTISEVARIIKECTGETNIVARVGGDEFAVIMPNYTESFIKQACINIEEAVKQGKTSYGFPVTVSLGYSYRVNQEKLVKQLFKEAEDNMYRQKIEKRSSAQSSILHSIIRMIEVRDVGGEGQNDRIKRLVRLVGQKMNMNESQLDDLSLLAEFYDIGKAGIPDRILLKESVLTVHEYAEMKRHCEIGQRIALSLPQISHIADWILKHHESWDGKGYPLGLKGEEIPLECRILMLVQSFDAITHDRPYRKARSQQSALAEIKNFSGTQFDPQIVAAFISIFLNE